MVSRTAELGVASDYNPSWGLRQDEFIRALRGTEGVRKYREMSENDPIFGAILTAMDLMIRSVMWNFVGGTPKSRLMIESILREMDDKTWEDFISEVLSFLPYGFSIFEIVAKRRKDGVIGLKKLAPRAQWTIDRFETNDNGDVLGVYQTATTQSAFLPYDKLLHFRTRSVNNQPAGVSVLRNAYTSWYYSNEIKRIEAVSIERELNGLPMFRVPSEYMAADANAAQKDLMQQITKIARDVKRNEQGYIIIPSDLYTDEDGKPGTKPLVDFQLVASQGTRDIDTGKVILRYQQDMARSAMADFVMLGANDRGSFAMSKSKSDLFLKALEGYLGSVTAILNRRLIPKLCAWNGIPASDYPLAKHGRIAPIDLQELGNFISRVSSAGATLFPNGVLEDHLLDVGGLPPRIEGATTPPPPAIEENPDE